MTTVVAGVWKCWGFAVGKKNNSHLLVPKAANRSNFCLLPPCPILIVNIATEFAFYSNISVQNLFAPGD